MKKKRIFFILIILICIWFPFVEKVILFSNDFKSSDEDLYSNNGFPIVPFIIGDKYILEDLDPHWAWDSASFDTFDQVCEGLFKYNLSHPSHEIIPNLASGDGLWSFDGLNFSVPLREVITFHDGYQFNASAVKWSFDRLHFLMNITGELPATCFYGIPTILHLLYEWPDGTTIINRTEVISEYLVRFVLNKPYGAFKSLLCFSGSYIVSPLSTPATDYIDPYTGNLVGTGPFVFDDVTAQNVTLHAYDNYWRGEAQIDQLVFKRISEIDLRHNALLSGNIHFIEEVDVNYINDFKAAEHLTVLDSGKTDIKTTYLGMNNKQINKTWRQAISYAINYSSINENLLFGRGERLKSPLPEGVLYANLSFNYPIFNVTKAREIMQSMGFGEGWDPTFPGIHETLWNSANFRILNYTYYFGNDYREGLFNILENNLAYIGIYVEDAGMPFEDFKDRFYNRRFFSSGYDALQLFSTGWWPDLNDPTNYINNIFSNISYSNQGQTNDPYLQNLIDQDIEEFDPLVRKAIYDEIQRYLIEDIMPYAWLHVNKLCTAHHNNLTGFKQNGLSILDFYSCEWNPYNFRIQINSPSDINFVKGSLGNNIIWTLYAEYLLNPTYNITVNGILNQTDSWESGVPITVNLDHLALGTYTYQIIAKNENEIIQDIVIVTVEAQVDGLNLKERFIFLLITIGVAIGIGLIVIITILLVRKKRK